MESCWFEIVLLEHREPTPGCSESFGRRQKYRFELDTSCTPFARTNSLKTFDVECSEACKWATNRCTLDWSNGSGFASECSRNTRPHRPCNPTGICVDRRRLWPVQNEGHQAAKPFHCYFGIDETVPASGKNEDHLSLPICELTLSAQNMHDSLPMQAWPLI